LKDAAAIRQPYAAGYQTRYELRQGCHQHL